MENLRVYPERDLGKEQPYQNLMIDPRLSMKNEYEKGLLAKSLKKDLAR
jgi:hypothetical protein|tara:strand:- start:117 stop:263 length:147 start_codon:yes stop_codon:yes gene_type:complete